MSEKCSSCGCTKSIYELKIPGSCLDHIFCVVCYESQSIHEFINSINCTKCDEFFRLSQSSSMDICSYCLGSQDLIENICQSHKICKSCISMPCDNKIKLCYYCSIQFENTCCNYFKFSNSGVLLFPRHMAHKYCRDCFNKDFKECHECSDRFIKASKSCFICKETTNIFYENECVEHNFCVNCLNILIDKRYSELYSAFYSCDICIKSIQKLYYQNYCSLCLSNDNLFKIFSCPQKHYYCEICLTTKKDIIPYLRCNYCIEYFSPNIEFSHCILCLKSRKNHRLLACNEHYVCDYCFNFLLSKNVDLYLKLIRCAYCVKSIEQLLKDKNFNFKSIAGSQKSDQEYANCMICDDMDGITKHCSEHKVCIKCCARNPQFIKDINCSQCFDLMNSLCCGCHEINENTTLLYLNLCCSQLHRYCKNCFNAYKTLERSESCELCLKMYDFNSSQDCIFCKKYIKDNLRYTCESHCICEKCAKFLSDDNKTIYSSVLYCEKCKNAINNSFFPKKNYSCEKTNKSIEEMKIPLNELKIINTFDDTKNQKTESSLQNEQIPRNKNFILYKNTDISNAAYNDQSYPKEILDLYNDSKNTVVDCNIEKEISLSQSARNLNYFFTEKNRMYDEVSTGSSIISIDTRQNYKCCCREQVYKLECGHSLCLFCLEECFKKSYQTFIENIINRRLDILNNKRCGINCFASECYCKMLIPFSFFYDIAKEVAYFNRLDLSFVQHYELYFEGFRYKFESFECCSYITGYIYERNCMWCKKLTLR
ncbi:hypothetical protein SteCoe_37002 [Stentor coeruleus]|uniref:RING-type domain-containing protein n=1 Tax=Stentor coeruleus TaxID=5963 RepID=A0A1R2ANZ0_9CILI|nr:hypothetical protein SteCoe_37002 [Stentor coeruleus]